MPRKFRVRIRDPEGKLLFTFKGLVVRKTQGKGRMGGDVDESLYVSKHAITYPKRKNQALFPRAELTAAEFGAELDKIAKDCIESEDSRAYSLQSWFAEIAFQLHESFSKDAEEGIETAMRVVNEADKLTEKLENPNLLEG